MSAEYAVERVTKVKRLVDALARVYRNDMRTAAVVARVCDEEIDRSGHLLGEVRRRYAALKAAHPEEAK